MVERLEDLSIRWAITFWHVELISYWISYHILVTMTPKTYFSLWHYSSTKICFSRKFDKLFIEKLHGWCSKWRRSVNAEKIWFGFIIGSQYMSWRCKNLSRLAYRSCNTIISSLFSSIRFISFFYSIAFSSISLQFSSSSVFISIAPFFPSPFLSAFLHLCNYFISLFITSVHIRPCD